MRRLSLLVTIPLALAFVVFAVTNRQIVVLNLWPFGVSVSLPLFLLALGMLGLGALIGAFWIWMPLLRWRLRARSQERRLIELEAALAESRAVVAQLRDPARPADGTALVPPPAG